MILGLAEIKAALPPRTRLVGVDLGTKTIGLALSDILLSIASPFGTLKRVKFTKDALALLDVLDQQGGTGLVFGWPVEMDGGEGSRCQATRAFAQGLLRLRDVPILFWDERFSTAAVTRVLLDGGATRARRAEVVDKLAAAYILQGALDALSRS